MATVIELLPAFEGNLRRRGRTQSTIDLYHRPLEAFATWAADREVNTFQPRDMEAYFDHYEGDFYMRNDRLPASNTRRKVDQAIRNFFEWPTATTTWTRTPCARSTRPRSSARRTTGCGPMRRQAARLLHDQGRVPGRLPAPLTGLRASGHRPLLVRRGVVRRTAMGISPQVQDCPRHPAHPRTSGAGAHADPSLASQPGGRTDLPHPQREGVAPQPAIRNGQAGRPARRLNVYPHRLRKTLGSSAFNAGADLSTISRILGHSSTTITEQAYAELTTDTIARDFLKAVG